jgi:hypothetical protein
LFCNLATDLHVILLSGLLAKCVVTISHNTAATVTRVTEKLIRAFSVGRASGACNRLTMCE